MADNKFLTRLKGKQAPKSSVQIDNDKLTPVFGNMPVGSDGLQNIIDQSKSSTVVAKGSQNWYLSGDSMVLSDSDQYTSEFKVNGQGLWINSSYTFTSASVVAPGAKWVLRFCGDNLLDTTDHKITLSVLIKAGSTTLASKTFMLDEQANFFCKVLELDFDDTYQSVHKFAAGSTLTVQLLCGSDGASATIYNGKTTLTLLQRMVDADTVAFNGTPLIDVMAGYVPEDFFNRYQEQVVDGENAIPVFTRDGTTMDLSGWEDKASVQVAEHNTSEEAHADIREDYVNKITEHNESETAHEDIREELAGKQGTLTAGQNIVIDENNVISATGEISVAFESITGDPYDNENLATALNSKQDKLTWRNAGANITITDPIVLPEEYTQLEYIESTGTQCIDTGITLKSSSSAEVKYSVSETSSSMCVLGARGTITNDEYKAFVMFGNIDGFPRFDFADTTISRVNGNNITTNTPIIIKKDGVDNYQNGVKLSSNQSETFETTVNAFLCALHRASAVSTFLNGHIYYAKIWDNDELVRDFIPAKRNSDDVVGMYDLVTETFFTNDGTGDFIAGAEVIDVLKINATVPTKTSELTNDSGFITSSYHDSTKQDKLTAGTNITISGNTISATDTKYTAGTNISISAGNVISATGGGNVDDVKVNGTSVVTNKIANIDLTGKQDTISAGEGINITGTTVSTNNIVWRNW